MTERNVIMRNPPSVTGRSKIVQKSYGPLSAVRNKHLLGKDVDSQEYLYGELIGIRNSHLNMFPQIWTKLQKAKSFDWDKKIVGPDESTDASGYVVVNHGSFEEMYADVVEPWLGKYDTLREIVGKFERGEITREEGADALRTRGGDRRSEQFHNDNISLKTEYGTGKAYTEARLRRDHPTLYDAVKRGELSANRAAIEAGFRKKLTRFEQIAKWVPSLSEDERQQLRELLK
jgi:hypothetical protein